MKKDKGKMLGDGKLLTPKFRIDWPHVCERRPKDAKINPGRYDCVAIWEKSKTDFTLINKIIEEAATTLSKRYKRPLRSGNDDRDGEDGYEDTKFATLSASKFKPTVLFADKSEVEDDNQIVEGSYARAVISAWHYDNENKGVAFNLHALQCLGGGTRLEKDGDGGNESIADEAFDETEMEDTEEFDDDDDDIDL